MFKNVFQKIHHKNHGSLHDVPDSKVHGTNMGPTWVLSAPDGPHVGPMNLVIRGDLFCFFIGNILPISVGSLHWQWGNYTIYSMTMKQPWRIGYLWIWHMYQEVKQNHNKIDGLFHEICCISGTNEVTRPRSRHNTPRNACSKQITGNNIRTSTRRVFGLTYRYCGASSNLIVVIHTIKRGRHFFILPIWYSRMASRVHCHLGNHVINKYHWSNPDDLS